MGESSNGILLEAKFCLFDTVRFDCPACKTSTPNDTSDISAANSHGLHPSRAWTQEMEDQEKPIA